MNTNLIHNLCNVAQAVIGLIAALLIWAGCQVDAVTQVASCTNANPKYAAIAGIGVLVISGLKLGINLFRDGLSGMTKPQPPVQQ